MTDAHLNLHIDVPPEWEVGSPADAASVWHTNESFVIDFLALTKPPTVVEEDGAVTVDQHLKVSARVRIPPTHVIELMKALERELSDWEAQTGAHLPQNPSG